MKPERFIIIDDDQLNNMLCRFMIETSIKAEVVEFINPKNAIEYISSAYNNATENNTILLLDINMPEMTGWEFLEWFETTPHYIKDQITIYILSSSVDLRDKERAAANPRVKAFLTKPVELEVLQMC